MDLFNCFAEMYPARIEKTLKMFEKSHKMLKDQTFNHEIIPPDLQKEIDQTGVDFRYITEATARYAGIFDFLFCSNLSNFDISIVFG